MKQETFKAGDAVFVDSAALCDTRIDAEPTGMFVEAEVLRVNPIGQPYICTKNGNMLFVWPKFLKLVKNV